MSLFSTGYPCIEIIFLIRRMKKTNTCYYSNGPWKSHAECCKATYLIYTEYFEEGSLYSWVLDGLDINRKWLLLVSLAKYFANFIVVKISLFVNTIKMN